jgi:hypothetical protein
MGSNCPLTISPPPSYNVSTLPRLHFQRAPFAGPVLAFLLAALPARAQQQQGSYYEAPSTLKMAELLQKAYRLHDWKSDPNKPADRIRFLEAQLATKPAPSAEFAIRQMLGDEMLHQGDGLGAVDDFEAMRRLIDTNHLQPAADAEYRWRSSLALAYLRLGEQENCIHMHGQHSCIFPIKGSGVHTLPPGAQGAVREYSAILAKNSQDASARWLLNIAYMQLGRYPRDVPPRYVIPEKLFASEYDIGPFPDVAPLAGLAVTGHAGGLCIDDFDGDGLLDLMISSSGPRDQMHFFHNNGDGSFSDRTRQAGLTGETGGLNLVCADFDNDGHPDVMVLRGGWWGAYGDYPLSLLRNNGNGTFDDVTEQAGLLYAHPTQTAAFADYDNDGWLDIYVGHESTPGEANRCQLYHNNHDGTFTDMAPALGLADMGFVKGVAWGDFNNDGRADLYVSIKGKPNRLFRNDGPRDPRNPRPDQWRFTDVTAQARVAEPSESFAATFLDYDNDGWPDLLADGYLLASPADVANFEMSRPARIELPRLYHNNHDGTFTDVTHAMHLDRVIIPMGMSFGDLDNDGWLDIYFGTGDPLFENLLPNRMFRNDAGRRFQDVTTAGGFGNLQKGHSVAFADIDNDGNEEIFEEMGGALPGDTYESALYRNPGHGNHWITLDLEGTRTNRSAIGARIDITLDAPVKRHIYRTVGFGSSFGGNPLRQHIGLGKAATVADIEIFWPGSGTRQHFRNVAADQAFHITEGDNTLHPTHWPHFSFPDTPVTDVPMAAGMHHEKP